MAELPAAELVVPSSLDIARTMPSDQLYALEQAGQIAREILDERIREWTRAGWSQRRIADEIGCSGPAVSKRQARLGVASVDPRGGDRFANRVSKANNGSAPDPLSAYRQQQPEPEPEDVEPDEVLPPAPSTPVSPTRGQLANQAGGTDEWSTPQDFFDAVNAEFGFDLDVCALDSSAKCERYFTPADDGLAQKWTGTVWMNPPYGDEIVRWVRKAYESAEAGATVVCLVPARLDTGWMWDYCRRGEVRVLRGRLKFGGSGTSAPFPSALVVFGPHIEPDLIWWEWR